MNPALMPLLLSPNDPVEETKKSNNDFETEEGASGVLKSVATNTNTPLEISDFIMFFGILSAVIVAILLIWLLVKISDKN